MVQAVNPQDAGHPRVGGADRTAALFSRARALWPRARAALARPAVQVVLLAVAALLLRAPRFGDPVLDVDEEFYLLVGDRMLHGAVPFVDIWDRKPIGLFLIYAAIRLLLGGGGIVQYQVVATVFAAATAFGITRLAARIAAPAGAVGAGLAYLIWLGVFGGEGGQSPVFYNLFTVAAAALTLRAVERGFGERRSVTLPGLGAMLIVGLAIQIKYTALFEGVYFGLVLLWAAWRAAPRPVARAAEALAWIGCAILPTLAALLVYRRLGQADAFVFANFTSIFGRAASSGKELGDRLWFMARYALPLGLCVAVAGAQGRPPEQSRGARPDGLARRFVFGWLAAAVLGVLLFGSYFDHYFLPVLVPLTIAAAPMLAEPRWGLSLVAGSRRFWVPVGIVVLGIGALMAHDTLQRKRRGRGHGVEMAQMVAAITPRLTNCMFVYDGEPILYYLTGSCLPSRYVFPDHFNNKLEAGSIGVDPVAEIGRILARKPAIVVSSDAPEEKTNLVSWAFMADALARDYHPILTVKVGTRHRIVSERNPDR